jgi:geranylgeranyl diphosphate synthase, type III
MPDESLLEVFRYVNSVPGKDVRGKLIDCFQLWFQVPPRRRVAAAAAADPADCLHSHSTTSSSSQSEIDDIDILTVIKDIVGDLHNASLLIDDIEDNSRLRRGIPVAHLIFGIPTTINTANYVYFLALEKVHSVLNNAQATQVFVGELLNLHRGQGHDIQWRDASNCPTEEQYLNMVCDKTGGLFRLAVGLMQAFATKNRDTDFSRLVNNLAMYFQIRDDFINLADEEYMKSKSFCEDLTEGKYSFPIIHCIRQNPHDTRLASILKQRTDDVDVKRYAQGIMKQSRSLVYTRQKCSELKHEIVQQVQDFGGNAPLLKILETLDVQLDKLETTAETSATHDAARSAIVEQT